MFIAENKQYFSKSTVARAPDGNGGIYLGLKNEGIIEDMKAKVIS